MKSSQPVSEKKPGAAAPDTQDTIKVVIRFKGNEGLSDNELGKWEFDEDYTSVQAPAPAGDLRKNMDTLKYTFDNILVEASQEKMYYYAGQETVKLFTSGFNGTIFAYGMSGTGKTYSMLGPETVVEVIKQGGEISEDIQSQYGIIPRAIRDIFEFMNYAIEKEGASFELMMNYFEIYKESLNDLLQPNKEQANNLKMMGSKVVNSYKVMIDSPETIFDHIKRGQNRVHTEATGMNDRSSRSHSILVLEYNQINKDGSKKNAKLNLVDLAGSERIAKTGASGKVLDEAKKINLSLTVLGRVIQALGEGGNVPFRESTLTKLLKESLGGNSKTALLCTTSRKDCHLEETLQSLQFAKRVKKVKNKAVVSVQLTSDQMQALIVKLKQEVYVLRQRLITANGSSFDKDLAKSDVQQLKENEAAASADAKKDDQKKDTKKEEVAKPASKAEPEKKAEVKDTKEPAPKLSIETQREEVKAMLAKSTANADQPAAEGADAPKPGEQASPQMLQTPRKDLDRNMSPDKTSEKAQGNPPASPFKTPCKGPDDKSAAKEGHAFMQSFASDNMSARKSQIENPYSSFISLQSDFDTNKYFDQNTKVCPQQTVQETGTGPKFNQEQFETLQELIQRQQVQLDSRNDLLIQRDTEIDRLYIENSQLTKNVEGLKEKLDNQAMDVYFKVAEEMNKQFKMYYTAQDSFQQMDELIQDLKKQSETEVQENNKSLFTSISDIEKEMKRYEKWIQDTQQEMLNKKDQDKGLTLKDKNDDSKVVDASKGKSDPEQNILQKENLESLQKIVNNQQQKLQEQQATNYNDIVSVRTALVNSTLTNLHVLHQYRGLLNIVQDNFMDKPRKARPASPKKPIVLHEVKVVDSKADGLEPNSGINADFVSPTSVQMGQGSFKTEEGKTACDTEKEAFVQVVPETQELITLKSQLKYQADMLEEKSKEIKAQNELVERLKRQHENLREQINRVDKENIKLKKKMDQDNLNKQQQYLNACQDPNQQFQYNKSDGFMGYISNMFTGTSNKMINKKVDTTGSKFFSQKVFGNNTWQPNGQNQQGFSPAPRLPQQNMNNANKRVTSPRKQNTQVNTYEYSNNTAKKLGTNQEPKSALDVKSKAFQSSAKPGESATKTEMVGENFVNNRDSQGSSSSNKMQKVQLSFNKNDEAGSMSHQSNNSYRMAGENPFKNQEYQFTNPYGNSFTNGQFKYQQRPPTSPNKIGRFENNGPNEQLSQDGQQKKLPPRVKKYTRQEIENRPGKYDNDSFYILPGGDFFDPQGFYFDKKGYDQLGGHYDEVTGEYIPGTEYAHLTMQKNQSYHAGDNRNSNKKNRFGTFDNSMHDDTQLRRNFGSFHAHQNNPGFSGGQQYSNFFPQKGGMHRPIQNQGGFHNNTQQDFFRRNTTNGVDVVHTPAKDKKGDAQHDQMSASSKNSFHGSSNFKSNRKPFKPTFTDDKPAESGPQSSANKDPQSATNTKEGAKDQVQEEQEEMLVTKL